MSNFKLVIIIYYTCNLLHAEADNETTIEYMCDPKLSNITTNKPITNLKEYCKGSKPCAPKCCKQDEVLYTKGKAPPVCVSWKNVNITEANYTLVDVYISSIEQEIKKTEKSFFKDFELVHNEMLDYENCGAEWDLSDGFLLEDGVFASDLTIFELGWTKLKPEYFCVDLNVGDTNINVIFFAANEKSQDNPTKKSFVGVALLISSAFLVLVFLVYCVLPQLRNLSGMLLMAYVATQCLTFVLETVLTTFAGYIPAAVLCVIVEIFYFACLSSFCWLNLMSFDIWWTFRGQRLKRAIHRRGELVKFGWYSLYGWGAPLGITIIAIAIDKNRDKLPKIVPPRFDNSFRDETSTKYYLHYPNGVLTLINVVLFTMTIYNIVLIKKALNTTFNENSKRNTKNNENRLWLYMKMSMLMGISWLIELGTTLYDGEFPNWAYILINLYNALIGVTIFIMFVVTRKTLRMLCKRFNIRCRFLEDNKYRPNRSTTKSSNTNGSFHTSGASGTYESDVEMSEQEISLNPNPKIK